MFRQWWRDRERILAKAGSRCRMGGGGRKPVLGEAEDTLVELVYNRRISKEKVTRDWIADQARLLSLSSRTEEEHEESPIRFVVSDKWINSFLKRSNLSLRRHTNLTTLSDDELVARAASSMQYLSERKGEMSLSRTVLMDKTAVCFEDARTSTIADTGARHVVIRSTGFASMRITVALATTATGKKLPPCVIWKRKTRGPLERLGGCFVSFQPRAWVDQELLQWLEWYFPAVVQSTGQYLVWDSMRAHIGKMVKERCAGKSIKMAVTPGGLTPYLQAGDVGIFKSFKDHLSAITDERKRSDQASYTKGGNPRPPELATVASRAQKAWRQTPLSVVEKSAQQCGFSGDNSSWFISKHDVYGAKFRQQWELRSPASSPEDDHEDALDPLMEALDEILIDD